MKNVLKKSVREELNKLATAYDVHEVDWKKAHPEGYEMQTVTLDDGSTVTKKVTYEDVADPAELEARKILKNYKRAGIGAGVVAALTIGGVTVYKVIKSIVWKNSTENEEGEPLNMEDIQNLESISVGDTTFVREDTKDD